MPTVKPSKNSEGLASHNHFARTIDRSTGFINDFSADGKFVILVAMKLLCKCGVDFKFDGAIRPDRGFLFENDFARSLNSGVPERMRSATAPFVPAFIEGIVWGEPPIAFAIKPIPNTVGVPVGGFGLSGDFDFGFALGDGCAEIVFSDDGDGNFFAQHHRFGRGFNFNFELGLLVFFDPELNPAWDIIVGVRGMQIVSAQSCILRDIKGTCNATEGICNHIFFVNLIALGTVDNDLEVLASKA